jgi:hypothetical protein
MTAAAIIEIVACVVAAFSQFMSQLEMSSAVSNLAKLMGEGSLSSVVNVSLINPGLIITPSKLMSSSAATANFWGWFIPCLFGVVLTVVLVIRVVVAHIPMAEKAGMFDKIPRGLFRAGPILIVWSAGPMMISGICLATSSLGKDSIVVATPWAYVAVICAIVAFALDVADHKKTLSGRQATLNSNTQHDVSGE